MVHETFVRARSHDATALRAAALGDVEANLVFDHMEDAEGNVLEL